ncbi:xylan 1,4-beta-xylosidase [Streptomyces sp. CT34]|uniref:xylan 1,4-beta-xylosidase n=1 Tax=Streptomyces sp. CT34 TaxID=1553907 RepID=UPI001F51BFCC|nr:xylan 1,4-beta-xylosidase [Streptomyces sp. CT34]
MRRRAGERQGGPGHPAHRGRLRRPAPGQGAGLHGRRGTALGVVVVAGLAALALLLVMCGRGGERGMSQRAAGPVVGWGFTHTQFSADRGSGAATDRVTRLLSGTPMPQNQHIMGWGADSPEPSPGHYDFADLDRRIALIRRAGGTPVLTLCGAPDWMKGGRSGSTDWSRLEQAPDPAHYADFAALAGKIARRYPEVRHFLVWNEFKGFFDDHKGRWNYEGYTRLYNLVYRELKRVDKGIQVGGPYLVMDSYLPGDRTYASDLQGPWGSIDRRTIDALRYWNRHKAGADFVVVDGSSYTKDGHYAQDDPFLATRKFADVGRWVRKETGLPLWWAEWYVEAGEEEGARHDSGWSERERIAVRAAALMEMAAGGATSGLYWNPENENTDAPCPGCLWSSTEKAGGGRELPMLDLLMRFSRAFPPHGPVYPAGRTPQGGDADAAVRVLGGAHTVMLVNTADRPATVTVEGRTVTLDAYAVRWLDRRS